jgi:outer membrane receptor for ferric coprogen and ferric-rhodotorulic acid
VRHSGSERRNTSRLLYLDGTADPDTALGLVAYPDMFDVHTHSILSDTSVAGSFDLFGLTHQAVLGVSLADSRSHTFERDPPAEESGFDAPVFPYASGNAIPQPSFGDRYIAADTHTLFNRVYGAARLSLTQSLKLIAGFNAVDYTQTGINYGVSGDKHEKKTSPYVGATWNVVPHLNLYASYSDIFQPQDYLDPALAPIGSAKGKSYEAGAKSEWFNGRLLGTLAVFKAEQDNFAQFAGYAGPDLTLPYYDGISIRSKGFEVEVSGKVAESVTLHGGYTQLSMTDPSGADARTIVPRKTFKLLGTWDVPGVAGLELGADARWQNGIYQFDAATGGTVVQGAYSILGAEVTYKLGQRVELTLRGDNLNGEKFLTSLYWNQAFYGEPRNYSASVRVRL